MDTDYIGRYQSLELSKRSALETAPLEDGQLTVQIEVLIVISKLELLLWKQTLSGFLVCFLPPTTYCQISLKDNRSPLFILKKMSTNVGSSIHDLSRYFS